MKIPTFEEAKQALIEKRGTPLDKFVAYWEPAESREEKKFRKMLRKLVDYIEHESALPAKPLRPPIDPNDNPMDYFWDEASRSYIKWKP